MLGYFLWAVWKLFLLLIWSLFGKKAKEWMEGIPERTLKYWTNKDKRLKRQEEVKKEEEADKYHWEIFQYFQIKWLSISKKNGQSETGDNLAEPEVFVQWLKANYGEHLYKHKKNKSGHFENSRKLEWYESLLHGANRIVAVIVEYLVLASVSVVGIQTLWEIIKSIGIQNYGQKEMLNRVLILLLVLVIIAIIFGLKMLISAEYIKRVNGLEQKRETWLRHEKAIWEYQYEMINYIMDSREYRCVPLKDKEKMCIDRVVDVWRRNGELFQENMKKDINKDANEEFSNKEKLGK